jgi:hypothetical protein
VDHGVVTILGPLDLPGRVAIDASQMYARNIVAFLESDDRRGGLSLPTSTTRSSPKPASPATGGSSTRLSVGSITWRTIP